MEKALNLHGKAEFAGARKVLTALKSAGKIRGPVKLTGTPKTDRRKRNPLRKPWLDGAKIVKRDRKRKLDVAWFGGRGIHVFNGRGVEVDFFNTNTPAVAIERYIREGMDYEAGVRNPRRVRNIGGFIDHEGRFHPIRSGEREITYNGQRVLVADPVPYSRKRAHEKPVKRRAKARKKPNVSAASPRRPAKRKKVNPTSKAAKKQEFLRRMRLGRLRAKRARARAGK